MPKLKIQLEMVRELHDKDPAAGYAGVFLPEALEKKYPGAAQRFYMAVVFPAKRTYADTRRQRIQTMSLHESRAQGALKVAVRRATLTKRVKSHTFRQSAVYPAQRRGHASFTGELRYPDDPDNAGTCRCENNDDLPIAYPAKPQKKAKSPLDF